MIFGHVDFSLVLPPENITKTIKTVQKYIVGTL